MAQLKSTSINGKLTVNGGLEVTAGDSNFQNSVIWCGLIESNQEYSSAHGDGSFWRFGQATGTSDNSRFGFYYNKNGLMFDINAKRVNSNSDLSIKPSLSSGDNVGIHLGEYSAGGDLYLYRAYGSSNLWLLYHKSDGNPNWINVTSTLSSSTSDIRLKTNIKPTKVNALSKINLMKVRQFNRLDEENKFYSAGFIADELEKIDSNMVIGKGGYTDGHPDYKQINTLYVTAYAIKGIQELNDEIISLKNRISDLEQKIQS